MHAECRRLCTICRHEPKLLHDVLRRRSSPRRCHYDAGEATLPGEAASRRHCATLERRNCRAKLHRGDIARGQYGAGEATLSGEDASRRHCTLLVRRRCLAKLHRGDTGQSYIAAILYNDGEATLSGEVASRRHCAAAVALLLGAFEVGPFVCGKRRHHLCCPACIFSELFLSFCGRVRELQGEGQDGGAAGLGDIPSEPSVQRSDEKRAKRGPTEPNEPCMWLLERDRESDVLWSCCGC
jgi:hypothetical protein